MITPNGYPAVLKAFGNINSYIRKSDATLSPRWEAEKIVRIKLPATLPYAPDKSIKITRVTVHKLIADVTADVFRRIHEAGKWAALENYGGGFVYRAVRNRPDKISLHSFGIAFDFDVYDNPLGSTDQTNMDAEIVRIFTDAGFFWGGRYQGRKDPMHFQFARNC